MKYYTLALRWLVPPLRRTVQALSLLLLVILPVLALYTHYKEARAIEDLPPEQWRSRAVAGVDSWVGDDKERRELVDTTQGTFWSVRVAGHSFSDPLAGAEAIVSSRSFYVPLLWSLLVPLVITVLLGRVFCGWICPMNTLLEIVDKLRKLLKIAEIRPRDVRFSLQNKYVVLVAALILVAMTGVPFLAMVYPPAVISRELHLIVFGTGLGFGVYLILGICVFELLVSRRWWCRYICPGGALYSLLGRFRLVRVRRDEKKCIQCGDCVRVCQFAQKPMLTKTTGMECTNCASCISGCSSNALYYWPVLPLPQRPGKTGRDQNEANANETPDRESPPEATAATTARRNLESDTAPSSKLGMATVGAVLLISALGSAPAFGHHILGLPHYSYKENYPQVPTLEYPAETGPYDVLMTSYPGKPNPGQAATIAFYIKDRNTGQPYDAPVTLRVLETTTFGSNKVVHDAAAYRPFDNQHKCTVTFPDDGEFIVELTMEVEGRQEVIPFLMVVGNPTSTKSIVIAIVVGLLVFLVVIRAIKVKRNRRKRRSAIAMSKCGGVAVVLMLVALPQVANAHHVMGLPHAAIGPYDIVMTTVPEKPVPGKATNITFYIIDSSTGLPLDKSIAVRVLQTTTFGENKEMVGLTKHLPINHQYQLQVDFPEEGEYLVELRLDVEGNSETIPFLLIVGEPMATTSTVIAIGVGLVVFLVVVRVIKVLRNRKSAAVLETAAFIACALLKVGDLSIGSKS